MTLTLHIYWTDSRAYPLNRGTARKFTIKNIDIRVWLDRVIVASNKRQRIWAHFHIRFHSFVQFIKLIQKMQQEMNLWPTWFVP